MKKLLLIGIIILFTITGCNNNKNTELEKQKEEKLEKQKNNEEQIKSQFYKDDNNNKNTNDYESDFDDNIRYGEDYGFKYNYRTGTSNPYSYNYDIIGYDEYGNYVYGNIDIQGKYGDGYIHNENDEEISVEVEWIDDGVLSGTDDDGNTYELEVE